MERRWLKLGRAIQFIVSSMVFNLDTWAVMLSVTALIIFYYCFLTAERRHDVCSHCGSVAVVPLKS